LTRFMLVLFSLFYTAVGAVAMDVRDMGKVCLFSAISGTITLDGKPAANARLVRTGDRDGARVDEAVTDEHGYFEFPAMMERTLTKFLPQEFTASQKIIVHYNDEKYEIWSAVKRKKEENVESRGKSLVVRCELHAEQQLVIVNDSPIHSLCTWDVDPDPKVDWGKEGFFDK
jgi:hypothetical protein